ncbi:MAG: hypothetical protein D6730_25555 [Bacteroidetes bacterium]|nr:MAG: hypothetical protein D6730_25555 [Bacteroidota bacterium]
MRSQKVFLAKENRHFAGNGGQFTSTAHFFSPFYFLSLIFVVKKKDNGQWGIFCLFRKSRP